MWLSSLYGARTRCSGLRTLASTVSADVAAAATAANRSWLEECVLLLLCVLALDQFADYGSDQVQAAWLHTHTYSCFHLQPLSQLLEHT
jgi:hypothetical protein